MHLMESKIKLEENDKKNIKKLMKKLSIKDVVSEIKKNKKPIWEILNLRIIINNLLLILFFYDYRAFFLVCCKFI